MKASVIITNARIFTSDESNPRAEAVAIKGNRIVYVGSNEGVKSFTDARTRVIDGQNHTLTPGFIDSHAHLPSERRPDDPGRFDPVPAGSRLRYSQSFAQ